MRKIILFQIVFGVCGLALALPQGVGQFKCDKQVRKMVKKYGSSGEWEKIGGRFGTGFGYKTSTSRLDRWLRLDVGPEKTPVLSVSEAGKFTDLAYDSSCGVKAFTHKRKFLGKVDKKKQFDDKRLAKMIKQKKNALIYAWSPNQIYSAHYYHRFARAAQTKDLEFIPVLDPNAPTSAAQMAADLNGFEMKNQRMTSNHLFHKGMSIHYPSAALMVDGKLSDWLIVGAMDMPDLLSQLDAMMKVMKYNALAKK